METSIFRAVAHLPTAVSSAVPLLSYQRKTTGTKGMPSRLEFKAQNETPSLLAFAMKSLTS